MAGFKEKKEEDEGGETHIMCVGDSKSEKFNCNNHGSLQQGKCKCEKAFAGDHCDRCADDEMLYPDCTEEDPDDIQSTGAREESKDKREEELEGDAYSGDTTKETDSLF